METVLVMLAGIVGGAWLAFAIYRLGQAHDKLDLLRHQRRKDSQRR